MTQAGFDFAARREYLTRLEEEFRRFDEAHPEVWRLFVRFAFELIGRGFRHHSADAVIHRVRWETPAGADGSTEWKCNNNHVAHYARKFAREYPEHAEFFRFRRSIA